MPLYILLSQEEEVASLQKKLTSNDQVDAEKISSSPSLGKKISNIPQQPRQLSVITTTVAVSTTGTISVEPTSSKEQPSSSTPQTDKVLVIASRSPPVASSIQSEAPKQSTQGKINGPHQFSATSRPYSAPLIPAPRPTVPIPSTVQAVPLLSRSVSAAGRLGTDPSPSAPSFVPQSYRNAIIGKTTSARGSCLNDDTTSCSQSVAYSHSPSMFLSSTSMLPPQTPIRMDHPSLRHGLTFGCLKPEVVHSQHIGRDDSYHESSSSSSQSFGSSLGDNMGKLNVDGKSLAQKYPAESASRVTPYHVQGTVGDEFPHLDIINDLLDDEQNVGRTVRSPPYAFSRQFSFPGNLSTADTGSLGSSAQFEQLDQYYDEGFHRGYGASNNPPEGLRDGRMQQMDLLAYANRQFDGLMRNQQPYGITDLSMLSLRDGDVNGYSYQLQDYFARGGNGYLYRP
ncbi:hypothetical protein BHE74_00022632 [Ensete ventricosum]|nr:hypothetical protein BHE74_00022632 [Ensete ventricosum]